MTTLAWDNVSFRLLGADDEVLGHLQQFFFSSDAGQSPHWEIALHDTVPPRPDGATAHDPYGVYVWRSSSDIIHVAGGESIDRAIASRRLMRSMWLDDLIGQPCAVLHASAFHLDGCCIVIVGDKYAGKTTLMLDAVYREGWTFLGNDHVVVSSAPRMRLTTVPTFVKIRHSSAREFGTALPLTARETQDLEQSGSHWASDADDDLTRSLYWPTRRITDTRPTVDIEGLQTVVLAVSRFSTGEVEVASGNDDDVRVLHEQIRHRWVFETLERLPSAIREHHLRPDQNGALASLLASATLVRYAHLGRISPLLNSLGI